MKEAFGSDARARRFTQAWIKSGREPLGRQVFNLLILKGFSFSEARDAL